MTLRMYWKSFRSTTRRRNLKPCQTPIWYMTCSINSKGRAFFTGEVESFTDAYFDHKRGPESLTGYIKPAVDRFSKRYKIVSEAIRESRKILKVIELEGGSKTDKVNAERRVTEAAEARAELDLFKKDLNSYIRFYEFVSQITLFDDQELERLCVFARHLLPMLRQEVLEEDEIDLSAVILSHYSLRAKRTRGPETERRCSGLWSGRCIGSG